MSFRNFCCCSPLCVVVVPVLVAVFFKAIIPWLDRLDTPFKGALDIQQHDSWVFKHEDVPDLTGKTYLVTGANNGLGFATVKLLAKNGANIVLHCRTAAKCDNAKQRIHNEAGTPIVGTLHSIAFDLADFRAVRDEMLRFIDTGIRLDGLILNAGIAYAPFEIVSGLEKHLAVNHFGYFHVVDILWNQLVDPSRVMTVTVVSSLAHWQPLVFRSENALPLTVEEINREDNYASPMAYGRSKLANVLFAQELSKRVSEYNTFVNAVHPGGVSTQILQNGMWIYISQMFSKYGNLWESKNACLTQVFTAVSPRIVSERITGRYFHPQAREVMPLELRLGTIYRKQIWSEQDIEKKQLELWDFSQKYLADFDF